jgi:hypothetical protein
MKDHLHEDLIWYKILCELFLAMQETWKSLNAKIVQLTFVNFVSIHALEIWDDFKVSIT